MRRLFLAFAVSCVLGGAIVLSGSAVPLADTAGEGNAPRLQIKQEMRNPWNHLQLNNNPSDFKFAIVSDRTGGHRQKIFSLAVEQLNLLQPEFVVSIGDLIEGGTKKSEAQLEDQWKEF